METASADCSLGASCPCGGMPRRRREVLHALLSSDGEKQAARRIGMNPNTFHAHARIIYKRFGAAGRIELLSLLLGKAPGAAPAACCRHKVSLSAEQIAVSRLTACGLKSGAEVFTSKPGGGNKKSRSAPRFIAK